MAEDGQGARGYWQKLPSPFHEWQESQGLPIYRGSYVSDMYTLELKPWPRLGQPAAFVSLADQEEDSGIVFEIAPGKQTEPLRHLFETVLYVLDGRGATTFWQDGSAKQTVEWQRGSVFAPPLNSHYQHFNLDGERTARLFGVSNLPQVMNLFHEPEFVFDCPYTFRSRYSAQEAYFTDPGKAIGQRNWQTNFIPDVRAFKLVEWNERGTSTTMNFRLGQNTQMAAHISEFPPGHYKKAHRHGVGAHVVILGGVGYSLLWFDGEKERRKVDWKDGAVLSPKEMEYHQHFNTGPTPARYLALRFGVPGVSSGGGASENTPWMTNDELEGIPYEHEDPAILNQYAEECTRHGAQVLMKHPQMAPA
ncbi:MAG TPA: ethanolamine ammonia lyase-activating protein [Chloroflexota bacterium]